MVLNLINNADNTSKVLDNGGHSIFAPSPQNKKCMAIPWRHPLQSSLLNEQAVQRTCAVLSKQ